MYETLTNSLFYGTIPLNVPYKEKNVVNRMGAYYNAIQCRWELKPNFISNINPNKFSRWLPSDFDVLDYIRDPDGDRKLSSYPRSPIPASPQNNNKKRSYDDCSFSEESSKSRNVRHYNDLCSTHTFRTPKQENNQLGKLKSPKNIDGVIIDLTQSSDDEDGIVIDYDEN